MSDDFEDASYWRERAEMLRADYYGAVASAEKAKAVLSRCHEAIGESADSDDDTLPEGIRLRVEALRITDERREDERNSFRAALEQVERRAAEAEALAASASADLARAREVLQPLAQRYDPTGVCPYPPYHPDHGPSRPDCEYHYDEVQITRKEQALIAAMSSSPSAEHGRALLAVVEAAERLNKASWGSEAEAVAAHHLGDALAALRASVESIKTAAPR